MEFTQFMSNGERKLVYVLVHDLLIGVKFEARVVEMMPDNSFSLNHIRLDPFNYRNFDIPIRDQDKILLKTLREITYDKLVENFSGIKSDLPDLLFVKGEEFFKKIFRPYIERRLDILISYCRDHSIPVYQLNSGGAILEEPYQFVAEPAQVTYHFQWTPQALTYAIRVSISGQAVVLTNPSLILLTDQPAWFAYQGGLYTMDGVNVNKIKPFLSRDSLVVPKQTENKYFSTFIRGLLRQNAISQTGFTVTENKVSPTTIITLSVDWQNDPVLVLRFRYGNHDIPMDYADPRLVDMNEEVHPPSFKVIIRRMDAEADVFNLFYSMGLKPKGTSAIMLQPSPTGIIDPMSRLVEFSRLHYELMEEKGIIIEQEPGSTYLLAPPMINSNLRIENDWFDLEIEIEVGDQRIPFKLLKECILTGRRDYISPDGSVFLIPDEWFSRFRGVFMFGKTDGNRYRISKLHLGVLNGIDSGMSDKGQLPGEIIQRLFQNPDELSGDALRVLRPYQGIGVKWLLGLGREGFGGCLADDMGLGKTIQVLAMLDHLRLSRGSSGGTSLVVMPVSLLHNWENEILKFTPDQKLYRYAGPQRNVDPGWIRRFDIVLTTYGTLRNDIDLLEKIEFSYLILDESQHAKNADSVTFRALMRVRAVHRLAMTGTPVENSLDDLWSQMTLVNQGLLGSRKWFRDHFARSKNGFGPIQSAVNESSRVDNSLDEAEGWNLLRELVKPFILRRTKEAVAPELPLLTQEIRYCEPTEEQWSVYESRKSDIRNFLINRFKEPIDSTTRMLVLQSLMKLRLIANHPVMADSAYSGDSGKLNEMVGMINEVVSENHKVLVFSQFVKHLKIIAATLESSGVSFLMLTGQDSTKSRERMIRRFQQEDGLPVFLVSLKAGGVGLNLTQADYVFLADPWWNPAVEHQAISRAHRIGQENRVFAYRFITTGTIEEKILQMQERKQNLADIFVNRNALNLINPEEVLDLLS
jgi:superfamily II DNA or RNA helicase